MSGRVGICPGYGSCPYGMCRGPEKCGGCCSCMGGCEANREAQTAPAEQQTAPYYTDEHVTLYHADAGLFLDVAYAAFFGPVVLVTDPPYGVGLGVGKDVRAGQHGLAKGAYADYDDTYENYLAIVVPIVRFWVEQATRGAVFTGPHLQELPKADAIGGVYCAAGSGRHSWGFKTFLPVLYYGKDPLLNKGARPNVTASSVTAEKNGHPCPKPVEWMRWLVDLVSLPGETIIDPFAGSGTTLVAAKTLGRKAIGFEIDERYCDITATRLAQGVLDFDAPTDASDSLEVRADAQGEDVA